MTTIDETSKSDYDSLSTSDKESIRQAVRDLSTTGFENNVSDQRLDRAIKGALGERETLYTGRMARTPTLDGDAEEFLLNLSAHKAELASGGEAESESGEGGSTNYRSGGQVEDYLELTRYGITAMRHVDNRKSTSIVRSY